MLELVPKYVGFSIVVLVLLITITPHSAFAQSFEMKAVELLKSAGFEEIRVIRQGSEVVCTIERGLYRSPSADFRKALTVINNVYNNNFPIRIILLEQGQAVYELQAGANHPTAFSSDSTQVNELAQDIQITYADQNFYQGVKKETVHRPVHSGVTLVIYPQLTLENMHLDRFYYKQFNLAPALQYSAWQGMLLTGQLIIPLINELTYEGDFIRPGFVTFTQNIRLPKLNEVKFTAGNFNNNRYGLDLKWHKHFDNSRWSYGAQMGLTGRSIVYDRYWNHSSLDRFSWKVKASYYLPFYQMRADFEAGQFIYGDKGARFDVYRHFGEVTIGAYATNTGHHTNGGFHFSIPLDPFHRRHPNRVRLMLPSYFDMEYNARNEFVYERYYKTSPDENRSTQDLYPQFIDNQFHNSKIQK